MIFAIIGWAIFGLIVGAIGRFLVPGGQPMGMLRTMLVGICGSFIGGFLGYFLVGGSPLQSAGWIGSIIGSIIFVAWSTSRKATGLESDR